MTGQKFCKHSISYILSNVKTKGDRMARIIDGAKMNMIGAQVKRFRKERKMNQQTLSNRLELMGVYVCRGSISRIEDQSRTVTDIELYAIAKVLKVNVNDLIDTEFFQK